MEKHLVRLLVSYIKELCFFFYVMLKWIFEHKANLYLALPISGSYIMDCKCLWNIICSWSAFQLSNICIIYLYIIYIDIKHKTPIDLQLIPKTWNSAYYHFPRCLPVQIIVIKMIIKAVKKRIVYVWKSHRLHKKRYMISESVNELRSVMSNFLQPHGSIHGILWARIMEWVAFPFSRGSFQLRNWT